MRKHDLKNISKKTDIEKIFFVDNYKYNQENVFYLGVNKDELVNTYSIKELRKKSTYKKIEHDMSNPNIGQVLIRGKLHSDLIIKLIKIAQQKKLPFKIIKDSDLKGDLGLALVKREKFK